MRASRLYLTLLVVLTPTFAIAQPAAIDILSAQKFFEPIYENYHHNGKGIDPLSRKGADFFDASLRSLMRADQRKSGPGEVGVLDFDPLCGCQDWENVKPISVTARRSGKERMVVEVVLTLAPSGSDVRRNLEFTLVSVDGGWRSRNGWRIHNVIDHTDPARPFDLRAALLRELSESRSSAK